VVDAKPEVLNHNTESVPRLYRVVRSGARYERTLRGCCEYAKELNPAGITKSGVMVGLGEETSELLEVFRDLAAVHCDILTIGQYLRPSAIICPWRASTRRKEFVDLKTEALKMGFRHVESGPWCVPATMPMSRLLPPVCGSWHRTQIGMERLFVVGLETILQGNRTRKSKTSSALNTCQVDWLE
jgi:hypothetical protein